MLDLVDRSIGERIRVRTRFAPDAWPVRVDTNQLENAVVNLAVNARDAMEGEGEIQIAIDNATLSDGEVGELPAGDYVRIVVADTGGGMSPEVMERVFEPFFTTKPVGEGTGLGLDISWRIVVNKHHGTLQVESVPGDTRFQVLLPLTAVDDETPQESA